MMKRFKKREIFLGLLLLFILLLLLKPIATAISTSLFLSQVFPLSVKPQEWVTPAPKIESVEFLSDSKIVVGQIFRPDDDKTHPAIITAMTIITSREDKPIMTNFAQSLARMGFVVLVANLKDLEEGKVKIQGKEVFISAFEYLSDLPYVEKEKISFVGFSIGSSVALKATEDPQIAKKVHSLVFFGGYFNLIDYLSSLLTKTAVYEDAEFTWEPREFVANYFKEVIVSFVPEKEQELLLKVLKKEKEINQKERAKLSAESQFVLKLFEAKTRPELALVWPQAPATILKQIEDLSPSVGIENLQTRLFILHDRNDHNVCFVESRRLNESLPKRIKRNFLEVSLFEHVKPPKESLPWSKIGETLKFFFFLERAFLYML